MSNGKKTNLDSGFLLLYDWLPAFASLDSDGVKELLFALVERQRNKTPFPDFQNPLVKVFADMIEPTIVRRIQGQEYGTNNKTPQKDTSEGIPGGSPGGSPEASTAEQSIEEQREAEQKFSKFWNAYPRKVAKEPARKAFLKLAPDDVTFSAMIQAIEKQKQSAEWKKSDGQFIPHPATWLNARRWEDEEIDRTTSGDVFRPSDGFLTDF